MKQTKIVWTGLFLVIFLTIAGLSGCFSVGRVVVQNTPTPHADGPAGQKITLPLPPTAAAEPSHTPTAVATYAATGTRTPTPTWMPTKTPTPTGTVAAATAVPSGSAPQQSRDIRHVVIISIDGLRPDALELANTPNIDALRAAGAYTGEAKAVVPSVTLVNHASMLGGMSPAKHGIDWNIYNPTLGNITGPTLFSVAHAGGLRTTMVVGKEKLKHLLLPNSVDQFVYAGFTDVQVVNRAEEIIEEGLPDVLFIHLPDIDSAGHLTGWMSPAQLLALRSTDRVVGRIVAALEAGDHLPQTLLIVTSDHGGSGTAHGSDSPEDTTIPWLAVGPDVPAGITLSGQITVYDTAATTLYALELPVPDEWDGRPVMEIFE